VKRTWLVAVLCVLVAGAVGYRGAIRWDPSKPDGTPRKLLDVSRLAELGWRAVGAHGAETD